MVELLALGALSFAASCRNPGCSTGRWRPFTQPPTSGSPDHCNHTMPALVLWASPGAARTLVGILCGAQRAVQPSGRDLEPAPRHARAPIMTTVSQDRGDASAGAGEPGYEASFGDRQRESRGRCARCGGSSSASTPDRRGPRRYEGWLGRPAFKIANIRDSNVAGRCQRVADGDQTPCSVAAITQRDLLGRPGRRQVRPADLARLVIALDRPRVERRAPVMDAAYPRTGKRFFITGSGLPRGSVGTAGPVRRGPPSCSSPRWLITACAPGAPACPQAPLRRSR